MMNSRMIEPSPPTSAQSAFAALRTWSGRRLVLLSIAGVAIVVGLGLNWSWLVAAGVAPLLLSALPCVAMCALGLCMMQMTRKGTAAGLSSDTSPGSNASPLPRPDDQS
jgi:hypothetical protein